LTANLNVIADIFVNFVLFDVQRVDGGHSSSSSTRSSTSSSKSVSNGPQTLIKTLLPGAGPPTSAITQELNLTVVLVDECAPVGCHTYFLSLINQGAFPVSLD